MNKKTPKGRIVINSLPKAGNNLLASHLEEKGYKRSDAWGISSMFVLQPTLAASINRNNSQKHEQGMIAGLFMPVEVSTTLILSRLNMIKDGEYVICHMPNQFLKVLLENDFIVHTVTRPLIEIVESNYHYIHAEVYHPLNKVFNNTSDTEKKYMWLIDGHMWMDSNLVSIFDAHRNIEGYLENPEVHQWDYKELYKSMSKKGLKRKGHVFRKGTPENYMDHMPESIQKYWADRMFAQIKVDIP